MDKARQKTDKQLRSIERKMGRVYRTDPALIAVQRKFERYMTMVESKTHDAYVAYVDEVDSDKKVELKKIYSEQVLKLTLRSKQYKALVSELCDVLSSVNQKAIAIANSFMADIYVDNYNEVATDCRKAGIKVNGEEE